MTHPAELEEGAPTRLRQVRDRYRQESSRYDSHWSHYLEGTVGPTLEELGPAPGLRLLDVGCGTGVLLERVTSLWPDVQAWGVDASPDMLQLARARLAGHATLVLGDVHRLPFPSATFDTVVSSSALHHWSDPRVALRELARVSRPGARLVLTDWNDDFLPLRVFSRLLRLTDRSHRRSFRSAELRGLLEEAGFRVETQRSYRVGWLWGMATLVGVRE